ncbi:MAG TPA: HAD-IIIA family hydrolase [Acidimicrobiales bacterium]|nr:HAD-IIIA family hydrolase [Acidimicrobiales bacterium]
MNSARPAVFLDRDGVVNEPVRDGELLRPPTTLHELRVTDGAGKELARLRDAGYLLVVVTNQPDVARGTARREDVEEINRRLAADLELDAVYSCMHDNADGCECRKPLPGLLLQAAREQGIDLPSSWLIGDRWVDIAAGNAVGVRSILLETPHSRRATSAGEPRDAQPHAAFSTLRACVDHILAGDDVLT